MGESKTGNFSFFKVDPNDITGGASTIQIGKQLSGTLNLEATILDATTKDDNQWTRNIPGNRSFSGSINGYLQDDPLLDLDGSTEYAWVADHADFDLTTDGTWEVFIRPDKVTGVQRLIHKTDGSDGYLLSLNGDEVELILENSGATDATITTNAANLIVSSQIYYYIKAVYDGGTTTAKIYINGVEFATTVTGTIPATLGTNATRVTIGTNAAASGNFYDGKIGVALISSSGTLDNVRTLPAASQAYWGFDGVLTDSSGNGHTLTGVGITAADYGDLTYFALQEAVLNNDTVFFDLLEDGTGFTYSGLFLQSSIAQGYDQNGISTYNMSFNGDNPVTRV